MANEMNYKYGSTNPIQSKPVATEDVVEIGDLVSGDPQAASDLAWAGSLAATQEEFHDKFLGVSCQQSRSGDVEIIRVSTTGVHEFDCDPATFDLGDYVGPAKASGNALENKKLVAVASANLAVGRIAKQYSVATKRIKVEITSTIMRGGPQDSA